MYVREINKMCVRMCMVCKNISQKNTKKYVKKIRIVLYYLFN